MEYQKAAKALAACRKRWRMMTPNEPPRKVGEQQAVEIHDLLSGPDPDESALCELYPHRPRVVIGWLLAKARLTPDIALKRRNAYVPTPGQDGAARRVVDLSADADLAIAYLEIVQAVHAIAPLYDESRGIGEGALRFLPPPGSRLAPGVVPVKSVRAADYKNALGDAADRITQDPLTKLLIALEALDPFVAFAVAIGLHRDPSALGRTALVLDVVANVTAPLIQRLKHHIGSPRPDLGRKQPVVPVPKYAGYPGGHAFVCSALAEVLAGLTDADRAQVDALHRLAHDIAVRRELAGLHCTFDTDEGLYLGRALGRWMVMAADDPDAFPAWSAVFSQAACEWNPPAQTS